MSMSTRRYSLKDSVPAPSTPVATGAGAGVGMGNSPDANAAAAAPAVGGMAVASPSNMLANLYRRRFSSVSSNASNNPAALAASAAAEAFHRQQQQGQYRQGLGLQAGYEPGTQISQWSRDFFYGDDEDVPSNAAFGAEPQSQVHSLMDTPRKDTPGVSTNAHIQDTPAAAALGAAVAQDVTVGSSTATCALQQQTPMTPPMQRRRPSLPSSGIGAAASLSGGRRPSLTVETNRPVPSVYIPAAKDTQSEAGDPAQPDSGAIDLTSMVSTHPARLTLTPLVTRPPPVQPLNPQSPIVEMLLQSQQPTSPMSATSNVSTTSSTRRRRLSLSQLVDITRAQAAAEHVAALPAGFVPMVPPPSPGGSVRSMRSERNAVAPPAQTSAETNVVATDPPATTLDGNPQSHPEISEVSSKPIEHDPLQSNTVNVHSVGTAAAAVAARRRSLSSQPLEAVAAAAADPTRAAELSNDIAITLATAGFSPPRRMSLRSTLPPVGLAAPSAPAAPVPTTVSASPTQEDVSVSTSKPQENVATNPSESNVEPSTVVQQPESTRPSQLSTEAAQPLVRVEKDTTSPPPTPGIFVSEHHPKGPRRKLERPLFDEAEVLSKPARTAGQRPPPKLSYNFGVGASSSIISALVTEPKSQAESESGTTSAYAKTLALNYTPGSLFRVTFDDILSEEQQPSGQPTQASTETSTQPSAPSIANDSNKASIPSRDPQTVTTSAPQPQSSSEKPPVTPMTFDDDDLDAYIPVSARVTFASVADVAPTLKPLIPVAELVTESTEHPDPVGVSVTTATAFTPPSHSTPEEEEEEEEEVDEEAAAEAEEAARLEAELRAEIERQKQKLEARLKAQEELERQRELERLEAQRRAEQEQREHQAKLAELEVVVAQVLSGDVLTSEIAQDTEEAVEALDLEAAEAALESAAEAAEAEIERLAELAETELEAEADRLAAEVEAKAEAGEDAETEAQADAQCEIVCEQAEAQAEAEAEVAVAKREAEIESDVEKAEAVAEVQHEAQAELEADTQIEKLAEETEAKTEVETVAEAETTVETEAEAATERLAEKIEGEREVEAEREFVAQTEEGEAQAEAHAEAQAEADTEAQAEAEEGAQTDAEVEADETEAADAALETQAELEEAQQDAAEDQGGIDSDPNEVDDDQETDDDADSYDEQNDYEINEDGVRLWYPPESAAPGYTRRATYLNQLDGIDDATWGCYRAEDEDEEDPDWDPFHSAAVKGLTRAICFAIAFSAIRNAAGDDEEDDDAPEVDDEDLDFYLAEEPETDDDEINEQDYNMRPTTLRIRDETRTRQYQHYRRLMNFGKAPRGSITDVRRWSLAVHKDPARDLQVFVNPPTRSLTENYEDANHRFIGVRNIRYIYYGDEDEDEDEEYYGDEYLEEDEDSAQPRAVEVLDDADGLIAIENESSEQQQEDDTVSATISTHESVESEDGRLE